MSKIVNIYGRPCPTFDQDGNFDPFKQSVQLAVLLEDEQRYRYRVYVGIVPDNSVNDPGYLKTRDAVVAMGRHARLDEARLHFPNIPEDRYET